MGKTKTEISKDYLFLVRTKKDIEDIPQGSGIYVKKEGRKYYYGEWSSMYGTLSVKLPKDKCKKLDSLK